MHPVTLLVMSLTDTDYAAIQASASLLKGDLHRLAAAHVLERPYEDVTLDERNAAKIGLFSRLYGQKAALSAKLS